MSAAEELRMSWQTISLFRHFCLLRSISTFDITEHGMEAGVDGGDAQARRHRAGRRRGLRGLGATCAHRAALRALRAAASVRTCYIIIIPIMIKRKLEHLI